MACLRRMINMSRDEITEKIREAVRPAQPESRPAPVDRTVLVVSLAAIVVVAIVAIVVVAIVLRGG